MTSKITWDIKILDFWYILRNVYEYMLMCTSLTYEILSPSGLCLAIFLGISKTGVHYIKNKVRVLVNVHQPLGYA